MKTNNYISAIILIIISLGLFWFYYQNQCPQDYTQCIKCDGKSYLTIYENFKGSQSEEVPSPFNTRIVVPYIAYLSPFNSAINDFHFTNIIFIVFSVVAIYILWVKLKIPPTLMFIGFFWLFFHWTGLVRHKLFDPVNVDTPLYFFHTLLLLIIYKRKYLWLIPLSIIATAQKESFPAYLLILMIYAFLHNKFYEKFFNLKIIASSVALAFITKWLVNYIYPPSNEPINSFVTVLFYVKEVVLHPTSILIWLVAVFTSYGAFLFASTTKKSAYTLNAENNLLFLFTVLSLFLSFAGGGDFTRISFLGFPFVMTYVLIRLKSVPILVSLLAFLLSIPILRIMSEIPQPDYEKAFHPWFVEFSSNENIVFWGIYMIVSFFVIHITSKILR